MAYSAKILSVTNSTLDHLCDHFHRFNYVYVHTHHCDLFHRIFYDLLHFLDFQDLTQNLVRVSGADKRTHHFTPVAVISKGSKRFSIDRDQAS